MNIKKSIDLFQLKKDKVSIDTSKELLKYVEFSKTTQEIIKELDEKEYQFLGKEGAQTFSTFLKQSTTKRTFNLIETYDVWQDLCKATTNIYFGQLIQIAPSIKKDLKKRVILERKIKKMEEIAKIKIDDL